MHPEDLGFGWLDIEFVWLSLGLSVSFLVDLLVDCLGIFGLLVC